MTVTAHALRLERRLRADLKQVTDAQTRDLVKAWAEAWDEVAPDLTAAVLELAKAENVTTAALLKSTRLRKGLAVVADNLDGLAKDANVRLTGDLRGIVDAAGAEQARIVAAMLPAGQDLVDVDAWSRVNERAIKAIVKRSTTQITALSRPLTTEAYQAVRRELIRGTVAGSNPRAVAARMVARAERGFNGGLNRALTISRTEMMDAHRAASELGQAEHADVLRGWVWLCALSNRTCPACLSQHGSHHPLSEAGPEGHQQCRCTRMPEVKPWHELGLPGTETPSVVPDAGEFFDGLPTSDQVAILGRDGHAAWSAGRWPMDRWAVKRTTPGWRDSYVPARPPSLRGGRSAA